VPPGPDAIAALRDGLQSTPAALAELARSADDRWSARPALSKWSAKEHVAHLTAVNAMQAARAARILAEDDPALADWDDRAENAKIGNAGHRERPASELVRELETSRRALLELLKDRAPEEFARTGRHATLGRVSLYALLRHVAAHEDRHTVAVRALLRDAGRG
jgi:uncharacterized damage-inducible protein DinB